MKRGLIQFTEQKCSQEGVLNRIEIDFMELLSSELLSFDMIYDLNPINQHFLAYIAYLDSNEKQFIESRLRDDEESKSPLLERSKQLEKERLVGQFPAWRDLITRTQSQSKLDHRRKKNLQLVHYFADSSLLTRDEAKGFEQRIMEFHARTRKLETLLNQLKRSQLSELTQKMASIALDKVMPDGDHQIGLMIRFLQATEEMASLIDLRYMGGYFSLLLPERLYLQLEEVNKSLKIDRLSSILSQTKRIKMAHIVKRTLRARGLIEEGGIISQEPILWLSEVIAQGPSRAFYKERLLCFEGLEEVSLVSFLNILSEIQRMEFYGALREVLFFKSDNPILLKNKVLLLAHLKAFETHFSPLFLSFDEIEQYILMVYYHALTEHGIDVRMKVDAIVKHLEENQSQAESLVESLYKDRDEVDSILIGHTSCRGLSKERVLAECRSFMKYYGHMDENFQHRVIAGMYRLWQREAIDEPLMAMMRVYPEEKRYLVSLMRDHGPIETIGEALKAVVECLTKPTLVDTSILERDFGTICFLYPRKSHLVNLLKLFQSLDIETRKPTIKVSQLSKREWEASSVLAFSFKKSCIAEKQVGIDFEGGELAYRYRRSIDLVAHEHKAYFDLDFLVNGIVEVDSDFFLCDFYQFLSYAEKKIPITEDDLRTVIDFHRSATKKRDLGLVYTDKYLQVHGCLLRTIYHELSRTCVATLLRKFEGSSFHFDNLYSRVMLLEDREDSAPEAKKNRNFK